MIFKQNNLPTPSQAWGTQIEGALNLVLNSLNSGLNQTDNTTKAQASNLALMGKKLGDLQAIVSNLSIAANQVTAGTFSSGVILPGSQISGTVPNTVSGTHTGNASSSGSATYNGGIYSLDAYGFNMSGTRVAGWIQNDGHFGTASSSRRFKTNIVDSLLSSPDRAEKLLSIMAVHYNYKSEVAMRDDKTSPNYLGPNYHVATEVGMIAEDLHDAGFWEFVVYERNEDRSLKLDPNGNVIPQSIHYQIFSVGVLAVTQYLNNKYIALESRVAALEAE